MGGPFANGRRCRRASRSGNTQRGMESGSREVLHFALPNVVLGEPPHVCQGKKALGTAPASWRSRWRDARPRQPSLKGTPANELSPYLDPAIPHHPCISLAFSCSDSCSSATTTRCPRVSPAMGEYEYSKQARAPGISSTRGGTVGPTCPCTRMCSSSPHHQPIADVPTCPGMPGLWTQHCRASPEGPLLTEAHI